MPPFGGHSGRLGGKGKAGPPREQGISGAVVFATPDAAAHEIGTAYAPMLADWLSEHRNEKEFPILIAEPGKLRIRLRTDSHTAEKLELFSITHWLCRKRSADHEAEQICSHRQAGQSCCQLSRETVS